METRRRAKILGKICPYCGQIGVVLYETQVRIVYECPNSHEYETRKVPAWNEADAIDKLQSLE